MLELSKSIENDLQQCNRFNTYKFDCLLEKLALVESWLDYPHDQN